MFDPLYHLYHLYFIYFQNKTPFLNQDLKKFLITKEGNYTIFDLLFLCDYNFTFLIDPLYFWKQFSFLPSFLYFNCCLSFSQQIYTCKKALTTFL